LAGEHHIPIRGFTPHLASPLHGGHLLHAAVGICIFNDKLALAEKRGIPVEWLRVSVDGGFAGDPYFVSTGITYDIEVDSSAPSQDIDSLIEAVIDDASIPRSIQQGTPVQLGSVTHNLRT
jgi:uncharacterized OsmC-like protein